MLRAMLLAPPGAGKGTQGERLCARYGVPHLATGDMLRDEVRRRTPLGEEAQGFMDRGELVPDRLVNELVTAAIARDDSPDGFVLDGFPRTINQAKAAYEWGRANGRTFHAVMSLDVPEDELVRRLLERGRQRGRTDDTAATIKRRLQVYRDATQPLIEYYEERGVLVPIDGTGTVDEVTERITKVIDDRLA